MVNEYNKKIKDYFDASLVTKGNIRTNNETHDA